MSGLSDATVRRYRSGERIPSAGSDQLKDLAHGLCRIAKATAISRSSGDVIMYSDMPMEEMSKDSEFPKKWMFGMAVLLKKGLHLHIIHKIDRPFHELILGLEAYIPMYMTGQQAKGRYYFSRKEFNAHPILPFGIFRL